MAMTVPCSSRPVELSSPVMRPTLRRLFGDPPAVVVAGEIGLDGMDRVGLERLQPVAVEIGCKQYVAL